MERRIERPHPVFSGERAHDLAPDFEALREIGLGEFEDVTQAADEGRIDVAFLIRGEQRDARIAFDSLEQIRGIRVGELVLRVADLRAAFAEKRVAFVEQKHRVHVGRARENPFEILGCFAHPLADHG